jgi:hypothetical protein
MTYTSETPAAHVEVKRMSSIDCYLGDRVLRLGPNTNVLGATEKVKCKSRKPLPIKLLSLDAAAPQGTTFICEIGSHKIAVSGPKPYIIKPGKPWMVCSDFAITR